MDNYTSKVICTLFFILGLIAADAQNNSQPDYKKYEPSPTHPFGQANPNAPEGIRDYGPLIGECDCRSVSRGPDQTWGDTVSMVWRFKYIMNGQAVQDETIKADGSHSGSIRQYNADSSKWYVHYYSTGGAPSVLPAWEGQKTDEHTIRLYRENKAPNGTPGYYRITFSEISQEGFNWIGEWVDTGETVQFPLWKIFCTKRKQ